MTDTKDFGPIEVERGGRMVYAIRINGNVYILPEGVMRVDVGMLTDLASPCGTDFRGIRDISVGDRATEAIAFLARTLRDDSDEAIAETVESEIRRMGGDALGAKECYSNLVALQNYLTLFYDEFSRGYLCQNHQEIADAQATLAEQYNEDATELASEAGAHGPGVVSLVDWVAKMKALSSIFAGKITPKGGD